MAVAPAKPRAGNELDHADQTIGDAIGNRPRDVVARQICLVYGQHGSQ
jgi:hypothetical protein